MNETSGFWFSVRCVFHMESSPGQVTTYEERITVWQAASADEAISLAEQEAATYADDCGGKYLGLAQSYRLASEPGQGTEVFSLMRDSPLQPNEYLDTFFDSGTERQGRE